MCAKATAKAAAAGGGGVVTDTKTWLLHLIIHLRLESTNRPEIVSGMQWRSFRKKKSKQANKQANAKTKYKSVPNGRIQIQIKIIFYGLEIPTVRKGRKNHRRLDQCQHRCLNVVEIIILCSLLVLWSTKQTFTYTQNSRWNDEPFKKCKNDEQREWMKNGRKKL